MTFSEAGYTRDLRCNFWSC